MVDSVAVRARRLWEELACGRFPAPGAVEVVENPASRICPPGWAGILRLEDAVLVTAPTAAQVRLLRQSLDPAALPVLDRLGPAELAYLAGPPAVAAETGWAGRDELAELLAAVPEDEAGESGIGDLDRAAVVRQDGRIVAAAGWEPWPADTAHLCVLAHPATRGRGLATRVAAVASADALAAGRLPQWRAQVAASRHVAAKLG